MIKALLCVLFMSPPLNSAVADTIKKIVIIGDSLTEGYGVSRERSYPSLVQEKATKADLSWKIVNAGISSSTTASAASRVKWQIRQRPDLIVLALGANDGLRGIAVSVSEQNLTSAIQLILEAQVKCLLVGMKLPPNYGKTYTKDYEEMFSRLAKKFKIPLVPFLLVGVAAKPELNQPDGIHPNEKGHAILAETMFKAIQENL